MNIDRRRLIWILAGILALLAIVLGLTLTRPKQAERAAAKAELAEARKETAEDACASREAYDRLKQQLFASARAIGSADVANFDALAAYAVVRMENPVVTSRDESLGITTCEGRMVLELPPGAERGFDGQRRLTADIRYTAQAAADGSGLVYRIEGADPIVSRLAAFNLQGQRLQRPATAPAEVQTTDAGVAPIDTPALPTVIRPAPVPAEASNPSFNCRYARTRSERMVCASDRLAARDRGMASVYRDAMADAGPRARRALLQTRDRFIAYRDRCPDAECIEEAYEGRVEEIEDIMEDLN